MRIHSDNYVNNPLELQAHGLAFMVKRVFPLPFSAGEKPRLYRRPQPVPTPEEIKFLESIFTSFNQAGRQDYARFMHDATSHWSDISHLMPEAKKLMEQYHLELRKLELVYRSQYIGSTAHFFETLENDYMAALRQTEFFRIAESRAAELEEALRLRAPEGIEPLKVKVFYSDLGLANVDPVSGTLLINAELLVSGLGRDRGL